MSDGLDIPAINGLLQQRMTDLAVHLCGDPTQRMRDELRFRPHGSLAVVVRGPKRGDWYDHAAGLGGDPLGFIAHMLRGSMREARAWALGWLGEDRATMTAAPRPEAPDAPDAPSNTRDFARRIWREGGPLAGTLAETYLAGRGLGAEPGAPMRFHPTCPRGKSAGGPAMLVLMSDPATGEPCGVHRTFLLEDGSAKAAPGPNGEPAKMMAGNAGVMRLSPDAEVTAGLGLAEGIETALSVMQGFGWRPVWAAASAGAIARFPVLTGIECLTIFADRDQARVHGQDGHNGPDMPHGAGLYCAEECATRWRDAGREARILCAPSGDFNDLVRSAA